MLMLSRILCCLRERLYYIFTRNHAHQLALGATASLEVNHQVKDTSQGRGRFDIDDVLSHHFRHLTFHQLIEWLALRLCHVRSTREVARVPDFRPSRSRSVTVSRSIRRSSARKAGALACGCLSVCQQRGMPSTFKPALDNSFAWTLHGRRAAMLNCSAAQGRL
jgi:hypothetical protein